MSYFNEFLFGLGACVRVRVYVCDVVNNFGARLESTPILVVVDFFFNS